MGATEDAMTNKIVTTDARLKAMVADPSAYFAAARKRASASATKSINTQVKQSNRSRFRRKHA